MKLLLVEDNKDDADFLMASLRRCPHPGAPVEIEHVMTLARAGEALQEGGYEVVLLDLHLPDGSGMTCVDTIQSLDPALPIVVLSGQDDEDFAVSILNKGVQDYLVKWEGQGRSILRSIRYAIERKRSELHLNYLAQYDPITGIPNRQYFNDQLKRATARARREGRKVALCFLDLDGFKLINDTLGHDAGDALLREIAQRLRSSVRAGDVIARLGGDEFAVLLEGLDGPREAEIITKALLRLIAEPCQLAGRQITVTTSIGITMYPNDHSDTMMLMKNADIAMYRAKEKGRNNFRFFTPSMHDELMAYHHMEHDIKRALNLDEFTLVFQPKFGLPGRSLQGLEALLRWDCPTRGEVTPAQFIPVAEESGHIIPIGHWVLDRVCRQVKEWEQARLMMLPVSINMSARQFLQPDFHRRVAQAISQYDIDPQWLEFEITEQLLMEDLEAAGRSLEALKAQGVRISIDDFGTGPSCLSHLRRLPIDVLKIDKSFVQEIGSSEDSEVIIDAIIALARSLRLQTVAEGVETQDQLAFLIGRGCEMAQGFLFGMPLDAAGLAQLLSSDASRPPAGPRPLPAGGRA
ncbi:MAG: EAL domain-containing protein [Chromatiales bacterium]|nr:EAL domain-containing protein [Chromatiales bacterium]